MSTNHMNNQFTNGVNVLGGLNTDSLVVNGVSISSGGGSGVSIATSINDNSATNVPCTQITYQLKTKNDNQDTTLNSHDTTLTNHTTSIATLNTAMDALYGGTALGWVGVTGASFLMNSGAMPKTGGTFSGDVAHGTNNISSVKDIKFSNALIGTNTSNIYCGNIICTSKLYGDGSTLSLTKATNFGTNGSADVSIGNASRYVNINGIIGAPLVFDTINGISGAQDIQCTRDLMASNALITSNIYCSNVIVPTGAFYYGNGSKLTGITASTDCTSVGAFGTALTSGAINLGTGLTSGTLSIGKSGGPQVVMNAGTSGMYLNASTSGINLNSPGGVINIGKTNDCPINIGYQTGTPTNPINLYTNLFNASIPHVVNPTTTHSAMNTGLMQTCIIPLSGEQGSISTSTGAGVLPTVLFRLPFAWYIYGARLSCLGASSSGGVSIDIRSYIQSTTISPSTVNSTTGTSIFAASPGTVNIEVNKFSSVGSTAVSNNGLLVGVGVGLADDSILGVFIKTAGTGVLGLKLCLYYTL